MAGVLVDALASKVMSARNKTGFWYGLKADAERLDRLHVALGKTSVLRNATRANRP